MAVFADGVDNIVSTHKRVAASYFADGSVEMACPPLQALLHIMAHGAARGARCRIIPAFRALFTRENVLASDWYAAPSGSQTEARHPAVARARHVTCKISSRKKNYAEEAQTPRHPGQTGIGMGYLSQGQDR